MIDKYGETEGVAHDQPLCYGGIRSAVDIPSTYVEVLVADDDDGDIENGTPNMCEINEAFAATGSYEPPGSARREPPDSPTAAQGHPRVRPARPGCPRRVDRARSSDRRLAETDERDEPATELDMSRGRGAVHGRDPAAARALRSGGANQPRLGQQHRRSRAPTRPATPSTSSSSARSTEIYCTDFEDPRRATDSWTMSGRTIGSGARPTAAAADPSQAYRATRSGFSATTWPGNYNGLYQARQDQLRRASTSPATITSGCSTAAGSTSRTGIGTTRQSRPTVRSRGPTTPSPTENRLGRAPPRS